MTRYRLTGASASFAGAQWCVEPAVHLAGGSGPGDLLGHTHPLRNQGAGRRGVHDAPPRVAQLDHRVRGIGELDQGRDAVAGRVEAVATDDAGRQVAVAAVDQQHRGAPAVDPRAQHHRAVAGHRVWTPSEHPERLHQVGAAVGQLSRPITRPRSRRPPG